MTSNSAGENFKSRQALEALRNGVPNREAVEYLSCHQPEVEGRFDELLRRAADVENPPENALGLLVSGDFGSGKSHLLSYLEHRALQAGFACSRVTISKETPFYQLGKVFTSAIQHARLAERTGQLMEEIGDKLNDRHSLAYDRFSRWVMRDDQQLHQIFPATLMVYENLDDSELRSKIESFWGGDAIKVAEVKEGLRLISQQRSFPFRAPKVAELPPQRLKFAVELIKGAGYKGWVVLLDELELVGNYSPRQRARSYAELARWLGKATDEQYPGLVVAAAMTQGFEAEVLGSLGKGDNIHAPNRLREQREPRLAALADAGIQTIEQDTIALRMPDEEHFRETIEKLGQIYTAAYDWEAPPADVSLGGAGYQTTMRYKVRAAINQWDLMRLYPNAHPETEASGFTHQYNEMPELEEETPEQEQDDDSGAPDE